MNYRFMSPSEVLKMREERRLAKFDIKVKKDRTKHQSHTYGNRNNKDCYFCDHPGIYERMINRVYKRELLTEGGEYE